MLRTRTIIGSLLAALVTTLAIAAASCIYLMATSSGEVFRKTALFGGVVFESKRTRSGSIEATAGVDNAIPLVLIFILLSSFYVFFSMIYKSLKNRKIELTRSH